MNENRHAPCQRRVSAKVELVSQLTNGEIEAVPGWGIPAMTIT